MRSSRIIAEYLGKLEPKESVRKRNQSVRRDKALRFGFTQSNLALLESELTL